MKVHILAWEHTRT